MRNVGNSLQDGLRSQSAIASSHEPSPYITQQTESSYCLSRLRRERKTRSLGRSIKGEHRTFWTSILFVA